MTDDGLLNGLSHREQALALHTLASGAGQASLLTADCPPGATRSYSWRHASVALSPLPLSSDSTGPEERRGREAGEEGQCSALGRWAVHC